MRQLADRLALGEEAAFEQLYDACADRLMRFLTLRLGCRQLAADVLQTTLLRAVKSRRRFAKVDQPEAYLFQIARHEAARQLRRSMRHGSTVAITGDQFWQWVDDPTCRREDAEVVALALARLDAEDRELVERPYRAGQLKARRQRLSGADSRLLKQRRHHKKRRADMARLKRLCKRLAVGLAILVGVLLLTNAGYSWWIGRNLEQRLATLRAAGEPTSFAELAPEPIPFAEDAAAQLEKLSPKLKAFANEHFEFLERTPIGKAFEKRRSQGLEPTPEQANAIREILEQHESLLPGLQQASACPSYAPRIDYSVGHLRMMEELINPSEIRTAARFLRWRMIVLIADAQVEEAIQTGLSILRLAKLYEAEPALVNGLIAIAVRTDGIDGINLALRTSPVSTELHKQLDEELDRQDDPQRVVQMFKTERALNLSVSQGLFAEASWLPWLRKGLQVDMIEFYDQLLPTLLQAYFESTPRMTQSNEFRHHSPGSGILIDALIPALESSLVVVYRDKASLRSLRIVNAIAAYTQREGDPPTGLDSLGLPEGSTIDPFSGEPLKLKQTDDGWVVYSVHKNRTDEGGDFKDQADWGLAPIEYPKADQHE